MFNPFDSSSSDNDNNYVKRRKSKTRTLTILYADATCLHDALVDSNDDSTRSISTITLATPTSTIGAQTQLDLLEQEKEKGRFFGYHPIWREMSLSDGIKLTTLEYFWNYKIFELFSFLITHLLAQSPEEPVSFLLSLLDRCIRYRDAEGDPPLVFEDDHIHSVYIALNPLDEGSITYRQYITGMQTLGLSDFNILPDDIPYNRNVAKDVFLMEAKLGLLKQLDRMLGKGDPSYVESEEFRKIIEYDVISTMDQVRLSKDSAKKFDRSPLQEYEPY